MKYISVAVDGPKVSGLLSHRAGQGIKAPFQRLLPKVLAIHT